MTSTKSFSTKKTGFLVVAVFSIAISIGLSQVSTAMALESKTNSVITEGPAVASSDDHIIKPINLNKGTESDEPLKTNKDKNRPTADSSPNQIFQDKLHLSKSFDRNTNTNVAELYESFDLPYTAIYKNQ